jgi:hypothetical protein
VITIQGNGTIKKILVNKKLGAKTKRPQIFVCYDLMEGLTYEEEDLIFEIKPKLFSIRTICCNPNLGLATKARACKAVS